MKISSYNPDVLSCLANLSNDEVFTPPALVNRMLDLLPPEIWKDSTATFLDPVSKTGVFLREIAKRLMAGLAEEIPDVQQRADHILTRQVFGIAITELTAMLSRRSLYCSKQADSGLSVCTAFDRPEGNIFYQPLPHTWENGRCKYCGASQEVYDRGDLLESHAYAFIHPSDINRFLKNMKFDVIIGNPPYQLGDGSGGSTDAAMPIYHKFIQQAQKLKPRYISMIIPSKWMVGGRGLQTFRKQMIEDKQIRYICDYENSSDCFSGLHIDGGICFFLWERGYNSKTEYRYIPSNGKSFTTFRSLRNKYSDIVIRDIRRLSIIEKVSKEQSFKEIVSPRKPFNINTDLFNCPEKYPEMKLEMKKFQGSVKVFGVKGLKGGARRIEGYIDLISITKNSSWIDKYKLLISKAYSTDSVNPPKLIEAVPGSVCTETFLVIGPFETYLEEQNCLSYTNTAFFKILLFFGRGTMQVSQDVFRFVPLQDFSEPWTDEKLYRKYGLTEEEIAFIESMIRPMD